MNKKALVLASVVVMGLVFIVGAFMQKTSQMEAGAKLANDNNEALVRDYAVTLGSADAKVTLVEFFDPACEACKAFYPFVKDMLKLYPDQLRLVLRYAPFHQGADYYVRILEASRYQDKYWETLELFYASQEYWASNHQAKPGLAWEVLGHIDIDTEQLKADMAYPQITKILNQDLADVATLNVQKTPSFFVNGKPLTSFGYQQLKDLIESEIKMQYGR